MEQDYENSTIGIGIHSSNNKHSHFQGKPTVQCEREVASSKWIKVPLIIFGVSLTFALGGVCGFLYAGKSTQNDQHNVSKLMPVNKSCVSDSEKEILAKYHRVKECLSSCTEFNAPCKLCKEGWTAYSGKCYFFSDEKQTWFESRDSCAALQAHQVIIDSKAVQDFLVSKIQETHWIGLNDQDTEGQWIWANNQTLKETGVEFWFRRSSGSSEPDNWREHNPLGENCACLGDYILDFWFDASCEYMRKYICEQKYSF
ncbi:CD209 antigen-like protein C isoform X2 [Xyrauchen texanus]|uniref:CD209 antigen-like protein C isoform X2 n=1 Tax=Xyrauchen texanus TaxID=154827 RepID=UPI0022421A13|nr:CD209 antigen-like protein C isoform X2 [Xyrauchen texanus]